MKKYKILICYPDERRKDYAEVRGYLLSISWLDGIEIFAHRPYNGGAGFWTISEMKTGMSLITNCLGTKKQALDALKAKLQGIQTDDISQFMKTKIGKLVSEIGVANSPVALGGKE